MSGICIGLEASKLTWSIPGATGAPSVRILSLSSALALLICMARSSSELISVLPSGTMVGEGAAGAGEAFASCA